MSEAKETNTKGLVLVFTGNGKGKTTAALGMGLRAWGQGLQVLVLQFIKGGRSYGELTAAAALAPGFSIKQLGLGFILSKDADELARHREAARQGLVTVRREISSGSYDLLVLDEILYALNYGLVTLDEIRELVALKPPAMHLVLTGRGAPPEIVELADLVTEMKEIKHPYQQGISAQKGVEY